MSFYKTYEKFKSFDIHSFLNSVEERHIRDIIRKNKLTDLDFLTLLSRKSEKYIEEMAMRANRTTIRQFGKVIHFYTPMYLSNYCSNSCKYCGFSINNHIERNQLSLEEVEKEAKSISETGLKHILILTGDAPKIASLDYLKKCCEILKKYFTSIAIEIYALDTDGYAALVKKGVDSITIYQETYDEDLYSKLHLTGPKKDYRYRLDAPERSLDAKMRSAGIGALLGLGDWHFDAFMTGLHADYLQNKYPEAEISVSLPRMRPHAGEFQPTHPVNDLNLVQILTAYRIFLPRVGITISTREDKNFRNNILRLGVTKMSAGSSTTVGGRISNEEKTGQFEISDDRSVEEMTFDLKTLGYQPVFKDWQPIE